MKKSIPFILILLYPLFIFSNGFILNGSIAGLESGAASLNYRNETGEDTTITTPITSGKFSFIGKTQEPAAARITITEGWPFSTTFFLENSTINIRLVKDAPEKTAITGSAANIIYEKLKPGLSAFFEYARQNDAVHRQAGIEPNGKVPKSTDSVWTLQQQKWIQSIGSAVAENSKNYAALYFIQWLLFRPDNFDSIKSIFLQLDPIVRNGFSGKKFMADFEHAHKTSAGQPAPEITGVDTSGRAVTLASLIGKVVLLDFWASYCGPCRQENHRMLSVYQKYHAAGFEILSFSLDNERTLWVKAIQADQLTWPQASDLRGGAGASAAIYDISELPRYVLIDRTGKIIAKDLHGQGLIETVEKFLAKGK